MSFLGIGAGQEREQERKARQAQDKANRRAAKDAESDRKKNIEWQKDGLEKQKRNDEAIRQLQMGRLNDDRDARVAARDYEFAQANRVYEQSFSQFTDQKNFNEIAFDQAIRQQDRYLAETLAGMEFDEAETLLQYSSSVAGLNLKKLSAKSAADIQLGKLKDSSYQAMDVARSKTAFNKRQANIESLKAGGAAAARGAAGRSAGKVQQGIAAEAGAAKAQMSKELLQQQRDVTINMIYNQRAIVDQLLTTEATADLDLITLNNQLDLDQAKMSLSRDNLMVNDTLTRDRIALQKKQADIANIEPLKPEQTPEIPPVREIPVPEYQDVFEGRSIRMPDPLPKGPAAYTDWGKIAGDAVTVTSMIAGGVGAGLGAGAGKTFHWGKAALGIFGA